MITPYEKLTTDHRVQDRAGNWYRVVEVHRRNGRTPARVIFEREHDGEIRGISQQGYFHSVVETEVVQEDASVGVITFK